MKKLKGKKEYIAVAAVVVLFLLVSLLSMSSIRLLQGNARVVNYVGIVRGATQKLVKEELMGYPDDPLIERLDSIVDELMSGEGPNGLVVLQDENYLDHMRRVQISWAALKDEIALVRQGAGPDALFQASQDYFELVNDTVFAAESYSESQVARINTLLVAVNVAFVLLIIGGFVAIMRGRAIKKRADALGKIAYVDPLTQIDNRASCERLMEHLAAQPPEADIVVFMFDMNDLKFTNDFLGHQGGDRIISEFARILRTTCAEGGFVGRFGGDEFLAVFQGACASDAEAYLAAIRGAVDAYNQKQTNDLEKIKYAAGYAVGNLAHTDMEELIHQADNRMYENKRRAKGLG